MALFASPPAASPRESELPPEGLLFRRTDILPVQLDGKAIVAFREMDLSPLGQPGINERPNALDGRHRPPRLRLPGRHCRRECVVRWPQDLENVLRRPDMGEQLAKSILLHPG